ncbi:MAG: hypothetical protein ABIL69_04625 [candidate division WOR-3 bacterium]
MRSVLALIITLPLVLLGAQWQALNGPPAGRADDMCMGWDPLHYYWVIYAADQTHKLYKSTDEGELWDSLTYLDVTKNPICVICEPQNAQVVYIGKNGDVPVWKSVNGGETWEPKSYGITNTQPLCFAMDPNNPSVVLVGCGSDGAQPTIFKTTNGGQTLSSLSSPIPDGPVHDIAVFSGSQRLLVSVSDPYPGAYQGGLFLSTDGGQSWTRKLTWDSRSVEISPRDQNYVYATAHDYDQIFRSSDAGNTWTFLGNAPIVWIFDIAIDPSDPGVVFIGMDQEAISWSTNYGNNWLPRNQGIIADSIFTICINPQDKSKMWAGGPLAIYKSLRQGDWWNECTKGMRIEPGRALTAKFPNVIYSLTGGSVHRSFNFGKDWTTLYKAIWFAAYDIAVNPQFPANVFIAVEEGAQVNHIYKTENYGKDWWVCYSPPFNPTRIKLSIDPVKPDTIYAVFRYGGPEPLARSTNNGYSWELLSVASPEPSLYAVINDPIYSETLYVAGENGKVYCSTNAGISWVERSNGLSNSTVEVLGIDPINTAIIYAGTLNNGVYKTTNYGVQWLPKNIGLGSDPPEVLPEIWSLVIDPEEPTILYIGVRYPTTFEGRAYLSVDGAAKWFEISNNLEQMSPYDLIIDPMYADTTFANTDKGVYIYKPEFNKSLVSSSSEATFANNGRKLLHIYATNELWACYESGGVIYAVHSTDDGATWSRKMEIGEGYTPALAIRDVPDYPPYIVWWADGEIRDTIYFAGYISGNKWSDPFPLVVSRPDIDFGPPSFVIGDYNIGHLAYSDGSNSYYTSFSVYNPGN